MWNVNNSLRLSTKSKILCFIWTMWNVNSLLFLCLASSLVRFIWTMWNVNQFLAISYWFTSFVFYLNYVECKLLPRILEILVWKRFIWTMWNVNRFQIRWAGSLWICFIWTMWNVNCFAPSFINCSLVMFYLNYVECKSKLSNYFV